MGIYHGAMANPSPPVVVLGVGGAGKSLALRRLMGLQKSGRVEAHVDADVVPSVGVDISTIAIDKKRNVCMKEIGGAMMPLWPTVRTSRTLPFRAVD